VTFYKLGRVVVLALFMSIHTIGAAHAHALPGTSLIFSQDGAQLKVTIQVSLDDLVIAFPDIASLEQAPDLGRVPPPEQMRLSRYFSDHFTLQSNATVLPIALSNAHLKMAEDGHGGDFVQVVADLTIDTQSADQTLPLVLFYDAVVHEVRSHRVTVYWQTSPEDRRALVNFRYNAINNVPQPIVLDVQ